MLYQLHELNRAMMAPWVHLAEANSRIFSNPSVQATEDYISGRFG